MITRFSLTLSKEKFHSHFKEQDVHQKPLYNIGQGVAVPILKNTGKWDVHEWGLTPSISTDSHISEKLLTARLKTLEVKEPFATLLKTNRCAIPADGWFVWDADGKPFRITPKNRMPFMIAGLWDEWGDEEGNMMFKSFTMITQPANAFLAAYDDRMPAVLSTEMTHVWLSQSGIDVSALLNAIVPVVHDEFNVYPVSTALTNSKENNITFINKADDEGKDVTQGSLF